MVTGRAIIPTSLLVVSEHQLDDCIQNRWSADKRVTDSSEDSLVDDLKPDHGMSLEWAQPSAW